MPQILIHPRVLLVELAQGQIPVNRVLVGECRVAGVALLRVGVAKRSLDPAANKRPPGVFRVVRGEAREYVVGFYEVADRIGEVGTLGALGERQPGFVLEPIN